MTSTTRALAATLSCSALAALAGAAAPFSAPPSPFASDRGGNPPPEDPTDANTLRQVNIGPGGVNFTGDAANAPSIAVDPTAPNRLVMVWRQFDTLSPTLVQLGKAYSLDGGRNWVNAAPIAAGQYLTDPDIACDAEGNFFAVATRGPAANWASTLFVSSDNGRTFPTALDAPGGAKPRLIADTLPGPGSNNLYLSWDTCCGATIGDTFSRSTTSAATWEAPAALPGRPIMGSMAIGPDHDLVIAGASMGDFALDRSTDAWNAGATPTFTTNPFTLPGWFLAGSNPDPNPAGDMGRVQIAVDRSAGPRRGWIYAVAVMDPPGSDAGDVFFTRSTDAGQTWSAPVRLNTDADDPRNWQWFPVMSVAPGGRIDVAWNDTRVYQDIQWSRLYYRSSSDGGATWGAESPVTAPWHSYAGWPGEQKIGDTSDIVSDDVGAFLAFASTLVPFEQNVFMLRINDWDCNANGVGDATDLSLGTAQDCNANAIPDSCDIASGTSQDINNNQVPDECEGCLADLTGSAIPGNPGYGVPDGTLSSDDFFYFLAQFVAGNLVVCDLTTTAVSSQPGYGVPNGIVDNEDFFFYIILYAQGC